MHAKKERKKKHTTEPKCHFSKALQMLREIRTLMGLTAHGRKFEMTGGNSQPLSANTTSLPGRQFCFLRSKPNIFSWHNFTPPPPIHTHKHSHFSIFHQFIHAQLLRKPIVRLVSDELITKTAARLAQRSSSFF